MKASVTSVLEHYGAHMPSPRSSGWQPMRCPEHDDRMASASLNEKLGRWKCHVCDLSEDIIDIVRRHENVGYRAAVQFVEERFGGSGKQLRGASRRRGSVFDQQGDHEDNGSLFSARTHRR